MICGCKASLHREAGLNHDSRHHKALATSDREVVRLAVSSWCYRDYNSIFEKRKWLSYIRHLLICELYRQARGRSRQSDDVAVLS